MFTKILKNVCFLGCSAYTFKLVFACPWRLQGSSMEPTLTNGQVVICTPWPFCGGVKNGDIVIVRNPTSPKERLCKRVTGVAGDCLVTLSDPDSVGLNVASVPPGHIWLEGDNRAESVVLDKPVPLGLVEGKVVLSLFPFTREKKWNNLSASHHE